MFPSNLRSMSAGKAILVHVCRWGTVNQDTVNHCIICYYMGSEMYTYWDDGLL